MKFNMKWLSVLVMLAVLLMTPALAATAKPVLVMADYKVAPAATVSATSAGPLMPGDTGTVIVTIGNTLKSPGTGTTTQQIDTENYYPSGTSNGQPVTLAPDDLYHQQRHAFGLHYAQVRQPAGQRPRQGGQPALHQPRLSWDG